MAILELLIWSSLLFALITLLLLPLGQVLVRAFWPNLPVRIAILSSFGLSLVCYGAMVGASLALGVPNIGLRAAIVITSIIGLCLWIKRGGWRALFEQGVVFGFGFFMVYLLLVLLTASFPLGDLRDSSAYTTMELTNLPIDALIPYNLSRLIVERIDPNLLEVVPTWRASDRGPLAGIFNAVLFVLLGVEEKSGWLLVSPGLYFIYQAAMAYLNLLSLLAVWLVGLEFFGRRQAVYAVISLTMTYFYFVNVLFSWPKLLMAYCLLTALAALPYGCWVLGGILLAASQLSHDSSALSLMILGAVFVLGFVAKTVRFKCQTITAFLPGFGLGSVSKLLASFLVFMLPWHIFKTFYCPPSPRLLYLHLFCYKEFEVPETSFIEFASRYVWENGCYKLLSIRVGNLIFPFDVTHYFREYGLSFSEPLRMLNSLHSFVFFQVIGNVGLPMFVLVLFSMFCVRERRAQILLHFFLVVGFGTILTASAIEGCQYGTPSHHWVYPALLASALGVGCAVAALGRLGFIVFSLGMMSNLFFLVLFVHYHARLKPFIHAGGGYLLGQALLLLLVMLLPLWGLCAGSNTEGEK